MFDYCNFEKFVKVFINSKFFYLLFSQILKNLKIGKHDLNEKIFGNFVKFLGTFVVGH